MDLAKSTESPYFFLSEELSLNLLNPIESLNITRWIEPGHLLHPRVGLILLATEGIRFPKIRLQNDYALRLVVGAGLPEVSSDGLGAALSVRRSTNEVIPIATLPVTNSTPTSSWREITLDMSMFAHEEIEVELHCDAGPLGDPRGDWLAVYEFVLARTDLLPLIRARAFRERRTENEIAHFRTVYNHKMYAEAHHEGGPEENSTQEDHQLSKTVTTDSIVEVEEVRSQEPASLSTDNAYSYVHTRLGEKIHDEFNKVVPDFALRIVEKSRHKPLNILSLCSGAARFEADFIHRIGKPSTLTLFDINPYLLEEAKQKMPSYCKVNTIVGDINKPQGFDEQYDLIICVSAIHHVVELERVCATIKHLLTPEGEFWNIGEQIGRNGSRLWPDAYEVADAFFSHLPESYRYNHLTKRTDLHLPNQDCSLGTFEGIRSEEIEEIYDRYFVPVEAYRRNCFLWRLVNLAYIDNYHLDTPQDLEILHRAVDLEFDHWRNGGRATELFGIYKAL